MSRGVWVQVPSSAPLLRRIIMEYKDEKVIRTEIAKRHFYEMEKKFKRDIEQSFLRTKVYRDGYEFSKFNGVSEEIIFDKISSEEAAMKYGGNNSAILNFSSYRNPGGGYLDGMMAQEESLCHHSTLFNVLNRFEDTFYKYNRTDANRCLYKNRGLYIPLVLFHKDGHYNYCNVITCAAPNFRAAKQCRHVTEQENDVALKSRINFVLDIAQENKVDTLILGAYGCGVFGQSVVNVASKFKECLKEHSFGRVVFAIPDSKLDVFESFFSWDGVIIGKRDFGFHQTL